MLISKFKNIILLLFIIIALSSCTETYPLVTNTYEEALVVEATITNELKHQEIKLIKSAKFEDTEYQMETGANVFITDDAGNNYEFEEGTESYLSKTEFQAVPEKKYQLHINTTDGRSFESAPITLSNANPIKEVTAAVESNDSISGVAIRVKSFDEQNKSKFYRYDYEETYKIVTPKWSTLKAVPNAAGTNFNLIANDPATKICYGSKKNAELLLESTSDSSEDKVDFLIRFISDQNYIITTRYSILVKQYIESAEAYSYYKTLKSMSGSESILSPKQPGILLGNIKSVKNPSDKIVGYFDVASVSTERIYFDYKDLYPNKPAPPYVSDCTEFCYSDVPNVPVPCTHMKGLADAVQDLSFQKITFLFDAAFVFWVNAPCGDCTTFASNLKPTFWQD